MDRLIYTAMSGAKQAFVQQAGVAHNLANASTAGYRAQEHRFRAVPVQSEALPTRAFVVDATVANSFEPGPLMATGRSLDVALQGKGWIAVEPRAGGEALTRGGSLSINANGQLQTKSGLNVIGDGGPISIPPDTKISIAPDGTISTVPESGAQNAVSIVGRLKLVNPPEADLTRGDDGLFRVAGGDPSPIDENLRLVGETLEGSNVSVVDAMVSMISLARQFELQIRMLQNADQNARQAGQVLSMNR
jgi:flagellar basal-body rod protein FlgF